MPLTNQKQVMVGLDKMAGRHLGAASKGYRQGVVGPLVARIKDARGAKEALKRLGPALLKEMDSEAIEEAMADASVTAALVGRVTAAKKTAP